MTERKQDDRPRRARILEAAWIAAVTVICVWAIVSTVTRPSHRGASREPTTRSPGKGGLRR